jgi:hypothetical protein
MAGPQTLITGPPRTVPASAVVWIDTDRAIVARVRADGATSTCEIDRGALPEPAYLAHVVRAIGDRERVLILGHSSARLALEREYVTVYQRPDRLVDVEPADAMDADALIERLRDFAA